MTDKKPFADPHPPMPTRDPLGGYVVDCSLCDKSWDDRIHAPSRWVPEVPEYRDPVLPEGGTMEEHRATVSEVVRKLSEAAGVPEGLVVIERASAAPFVASAPIDGAPATHTGRPAMHSGQPYPTQDLFADDRAGLVHNGITTQFYPCKATITHDRHLHQPGDNTEWFTCDGKDEWGPNPFDKGMRCPVSKVCEDFLTLKDDELVDHMQSVHNMGDDVIGPYVDDPWLANEDRSAWKTRTFWRRYGVGPNGQPNGVSVGSPVWGQSVDCPGGCGDAFIKGNLRRHLQVVHQWTGDQWDDWAEETNFLDLPLVPESLKKVAADFFNADVPTDALKLADEPDNAKAAELEQWWLDRSRSEAAQVIPKSIEYGSNSLMQVGRKMAQLNGRDVTDTEALELGCWSYAVGKVERWTDAVMRGDRPGDDTLHDIGVYVKMAQRIRDVGSWPGV